MNTDQLLIVLRSLQKYLIQLKQKATEMHDVRRTPEWKRIEKNKRHVLNQVLISQLTNTNSNIREIKAAIKQTQRQIAESAKG